MVNVTISVDEDVLRRARIRALQQHESVNGYLADVLRRYADADQAKGVFADLVDIAREHPAGHEAQGRTWSRDELHRG